MKVLKTFSVDFEIALELEKAKNINASGLVNGFFKTYFNLKENKEEENKEDLSIKIQKKQAELLKLEENKLKLDIKEKRLIETSPGIWVPRKKNGGIRVN